MTLCCKPLAVDRFGNEMGVGAGVGRLVARGTTVPPGPRVTPTPPPAPAPLFTGAPLQVWVASLKLTGGDVHGDGYSLDAYAQSWLTSSQHVVKSGLHWLSWDDVQVPGDGFGSRNGPVHPEYVGSQLSPQKPYCTDRC